MTKIIIQKGMSQTSAIVILVIIVLVLAGLGFYYIKQEKETNTDQTQINNQNIVANVNEDTAALMQEAVFNKNNIAFSLIFPADWIYDRYVSGNDTSERAVLMSAESPNYSQDFKSTDTQATYSPMQIFIRYYNSTGITLEAWYTEHLPELVESYQGKPYTEKDITINNVPAKDFQISFSETDPISQQINSYYNRFVYLKNDDKIFEIHLYGHPDLVEHFMSTTNNIISSFEFLDPSSIPENPAPVSSSPDWYSWDNGTAGLTDWYSYKPITEQEDKWVGAGDCGGEEFSEFQEEAATGEMYRLILPGDLELIWTPNYENWSNTKFLSFNNDSQSICAVAGRYPLKAYPDRLLWISSCSTGVQPEEGTLEYDLLQKCSDSMERVDKFFGTE